MAIPVLLINEYHVLGRGRHKEVLAAIYTREGLELAAQRERPGTVFSSFSREMEKLRRIQETVGIDALNLAFEDTIVPKEDRPKDFYLFPRATEDLQTTCTERDLTTAQCIRLSRGLFRGLSQLHQHNIVHGDLKPENVLFFERSTDCKVSDFGHAHSFDNPTETSIYLGSPRYKNPERAQHQKGDVYSGGIILADLLRATFCKDQKMLENFFTERGVNMQCRYKGPLALLNLLADLIRWAIFSGTGKILEDTEDRKTATLAFIQEIEDKVKDLPEEEERREAERLIELCKNALEVNPSDRKSAAKILEEMEKPLPSSESKP